MQNRDKEQKAPKPAPMGQNQQPAEGARDKNPAPGDAQKAQPQKQR